MARRGGHPTIRLRSFGDNPLVAPPMHLRPLRPVLASSHTIARRFVAHQK